MENLAYEEMVMKLVSESLGLSRNKAHDYAGEDKLANFKRVNRIAQEYDIKFRAPHEYALFMLLMKLDRLQNLLKQGKTPKCESLEDTIKDAFNYLMLMYACLEEQSNEKTT